jgi:uridine phosphorylase
MTVSSGDKIVVPHLLLSPGDISPVVLVVGDPFRTEILAKHADGGYKELKFNREYRTFNVTHKGMHISICSHGIGGPGAAICFEELIKCGAKVIMRLGTCGSLLPRKIGQGDLVITTGSIRDDGCTQYMVPAGFPAISDIDVVTELRNTAQTLTYEHGKVFTGLTYTSAVFYPGPTKGDNLPLAASSGALIVEMETSCLLTIASIRGIRAGAIAAVDGSPFEWGEGNYDPTGSRVSLAKEHMFRIGLDAAAKLASKRVWESDSTN